MIVRLLPKSEIERRKAEERRIDIQEGMKVAERVDSLRETLSSETAAFERYREETLQAIQGDIREKELERDSLIAEIRSRQCELDDLLTPMKLEDRWVAFVKGEKKRIDSQIKTNQAEEARLSILSESLARQKNETNLLKESLESEKAEYVKLMSSAKDKDDESSRVLSDAKEKANGIISAALAQDKKSTARAKQLDDLASHLALKEKELEEESRSIRKREFAVIAKELQYYSPVHK